MFRIKICGITSVEDGRAAAEAGADAIGLNCFESSPRYCAPSQARQIAEALPKHVCKVGVFVNATAQHVHQTAREIGLDAVQLHGDEPPELLAGLRGLAVVRAFRVASDYPAVQEYLQRCHRLRCVPRMVLVDALKAGQYGGTGETLDWQTLHENRSAPAGTPLVLAGGLTPTNVAAAIAAVMPWAVDTASGVEIAAGKKSPDLIRQFVEAARTAFKQASTRPMIGG